MLQTFRRDQMSRILHWTLLDVTFTEVQPQIVVCCNVEDVFMEDVFVLLYGGGRHQNVIHHSHRPTNALQHIVHDALEDFQWAFSAEVKF